MAGIPRSSRRRWPATGLAWAVGLSILTPGCATDATTVNAVDVQALWFSRPADGQVSSGVTEVAVAAARADGDDFAVDLAGLTKAGAGASWNSAAWSAATIGTLAAGVDPRGLTISYDLAEQIDGPSSGALLAVGVLAASQADVRLGESASLTGTVLPSGGVGQVGGLPEKLRGASSAGLATVLIPQGQRVAVDPRDGTRVDVVAEGAELGLEVIEVASLREAYERLASDAAPRPTSPAPAIATDLLAASAGWAQDAADRLESRPVAPAATANSRPERQRLEAGLIAARARVPELLAAGRSIDAYARATLTERAVLAWNADAETVQRLEAGSDAAAVATELVEVASGITSEAAAAIAQGAESDVQYLEQLVALPDALSWGTDADALATAARTRVGNLGPSPTDWAAMGTAAADLSQAAYDLDHFLPNSLAALQLIPGTPLPREGGAVSVMAGYAELVADAAQANIAYLETVEQRASAPADTERALAAILAEQWQSRPELSTPESVVSGLSTALSFFVASTTAIALAEAPGTSAGDSLDDAFALATQVAVATDETVLTVGALAEQNVQTSYVQWNDVLGRAIATAPGNTGITDQIRLNGLQLQWYGNVEGKILTVLAAADS